MSVLLSLGNGAIIDHEAWLVRLLEEHKFHHQEKESTERRLNFQGLFDLRTPYLMDGQAQKIAEQLQGNNEEQKEPKRKKKKKEQVPVEADNESEVQHILNVFTTLRLTQEFKKEFSYIPNVEDYKRNNSDIRKLRSRFLDASNISLMPLDELSEGSKFSTKSLNGNQYILPPYVHYICDNISNIQSHTLGGKFDFIVIDPPWQNKYVKRKNTARGTHHGYDMMSVEDILQIPVSALLRDGGLLAIWCTNNHSQIQNFLQGLHSWSVDLVTTWYWLKLTRAGEPVTPLTGGRHPKLPYERVFIARKHKTKVCCENIPEGLVFCSVPSGIHSHKPPLIELLRKCLAPEPRCLELFARSLTPGWTCYGLEVLRLQHSYLFED